ncbi:MAG: ribokinase [Gorillibacterium sp.]|nr:ribokinase [Gorillibacterium sp.]
MKQIAVIGSLNVDIFLTVDRFPRPGENVFAQDFRILLGGGKGANQAYALGRLGADVSMIGKIGDRFYGPDYLEVLSRSGVDVSMVSIEPGMYPGIGAVTVDRSGENSIIVYPGANGAVDIKYMEQCLEKLYAKDLFLFQLEIPVETTLYAASRLKANNKILIFDPAPAGSVPDELFAYMDYVTPNHTELENLSGMFISETLDYRKAAEVLLGKGASTVIAKAGSRGAFIIDRNRMLLVEGYSVQTVDSTAAGDSFNAGLAYALAQGEDDLPQCVAFANAVAALSTTALGAQEAMPDLEGVRRLMAQNKQIRVTDLS